MILKNISKYEQLVTTIDWKKLVKPWEEFKTHKWEQLVKMYPHLFEEVVQEPNGTSQKQNNKKSQTQ